MKSIDEKIAQSEAEWKRYRYENAGVRESAARVIKSFTLSGNASGLPSAAASFCRAVKKSIGRRTACLLRNIYPGMKKTAFAASYDADRENIVVSLTSTADRIGSIFPTLYSLARQSRRPDLIVLWLGHGGNYPEHVMAGIKALGIRVRYVKDLGPYTKYHYAFARYKKDVVITVDDDIIYHRDMVKELYETHLKQPEKVVARRVHRMRFDRDRNLLKYTDWIWEYKDPDRPSFDLFATGVGGVLYPPLVTALECWKNTDFLKVCPWADDIWLKFCELSNHIGVCAVLRTGTDMDAANLRIKRSGLSAKNLKGGRNDRYIKACTRYFGFDGELCERVLGE
ncbi:MAG: hypothetical protein K6F86_01570 [Lachnospiraceae bacterium]|nr:hypothetical protein [Lachnospiraceae bacterium]